MMVAATDLTPSCGDNPQEGTVNTDVPAIKRGAIYIGSGFYPVLSSKRSFYGIKTGRETAFLTTDEAKIVSESVLFVRKTATTKQS